MSTAVGSHIGRGKKMEGWGGEGRALELTDYSNWSPTQQGGRKREGALMVTVAPELGKNETELGGRVEMGEKGNGDGEEVF